MEPRQESERLATGKKVIRQFDASGNLVQEMHAYGSMDIGITMYFAGGVKSSEIYFNKRRMVGRPAYEKARLAYPDMPAADGAVEDFGADLLRGVAQEKRREAAARKSHVADPERAEAGDEFCRELMGRGRCADAIEWIAEKGHTLGERTPAASRQLVRRLVETGCPKVVACDIEVEDGEENTGHLVVELPQGAAERAKVLKAIARMAARQGYRGDPDDGQRYAYVKLD